jgi:tRNA dimethylallyltransferase
MTPHPTDRPAGPAAISCLVLFGPTASGKSALAMDLARTLDGTVINADSMQIYRDLRILTARPPAEDEAAVPHRLYGVMDAAERCSASLWRDRAVEEIRAASAARRVPILCGGTGFYIKALTQGLSPMPEIPPEIRRTVRAEVDVAPGTEAWERLRAADPQAARRIEPMDRQRIARALEVLAATGRTLSDWQAVPPTGPPADLRFTLIALDPPRAALRAACDARLDAMLAAGALEEVRALMARDLPPDRPLLRAVGVPELAAHLAGACSLATALEDAKTATRRYAKRQTTWLKTQIIPDYRLTAQYSERFLPDILSFVEEIGLIRP